MRPFVAAALVFGISAAVLVLEILAGRLLAPFVGVTLETYTGIIGVVLGGISLGTWLGGRAADRVDPRALIGPLLVAGGGLALLVVPLITGVAGLRPGSGPLSIVFFALVAFFAPSAVLSAIPPAIVKLQLRDLAETGGVVGRFSALGTAGAIVGTFVTGFVLVAAIPSRPIVIGLGILLVIAGLAVSFSLAPGYRLRRRNGIRDGRGRVRGGGTGLLLAAAAFVVLGGGASFLAPGPCQRESAYFCVRVEPDAERPSGRTLFLDTLRHSYVDLADPTHLEFSYAQVFGDVVDATAPAGEARDALHIGGGGFTIPRYLAATRPGSLSRVLELDPTVLAVAREELGLVTSMALDVRIGDARLGIRDEATDAYDLVVGDAFGGLAVPWHLTTRELVLDVQRVLRPGGVYLLNVIDYPPLGFARAEAATLRSVFAHVALIAPVERIEGRAGGNLVLLASDAPLALDAILGRNRARGDDDALAAGRDLDAFVGAAPILTDDHAPVDQLLTTPA